MTLGTVGVIGLGNMGRHVVGHLLAAGHEVLVHSRSRPPIERALTQGAVEADGPAGLGAACDTVITFLPADAEVRQILLGADGVLSTAGAGTVLIDMSTVAPETARAVATAAAVRGVSALDAPVSGGPAGARDATMAIMVGGDPEVFAAAKPLLETLGGTVVHVGPSGAGQVTKSANQLVVAAIIQALSEAIALLEASGVDPEQALRAIGGGLAGNQVLATKGAAMLRRDFAPGGRAELHHKDLGIALAAARDAGVFVPVSALIHQLFGALSATGRGSLDHSALLALVDEFSGVARE